jgi:hypothetical protein
MDVVPWSEARKVAMENLEQKLMLRRNQYSYTKTKTQKPTLETK